MPEYVDGFLLKIPKKNIDAYRKIAQKAGKVWIEHGALDYRECIGEDLKIKFGIPFGKLVGAKPSETVVFAWITYKSKADRDKINKKVMADPRLSSMGPDSMPFDMNQMSCGGFETLVSVKKAK